MGAFLAQTSGFLSALPCCWRIFGWGTVVPPQTRRPLIVPKPPCAGVLAPRVAAGGAGAATTADTSTSAAAPDVRKKGGVHRPHPLGIDRFASFITNKPSR